MIPLSSKGSSLDWYHLQLLMGAVAISGGSLTIPPSATRKLPPDSCLIKEIDLDGNLVLRLDTTSRIADEESKRAREIYVAPVAAAAASDAKGEEWRETLPASEPQPASPMELMPSSPRSARPSPPPPPPSPPIAESFPPMTDAQLAEMELAMADRAAALQRDREVAQGNELNPHRSPIRTRRR